MKQITAKLTLSIGDEVFEKVLQFQVSQDQIKRNRVLGSIDYILAPFNQIEQERKSSAERKEFIDWLDKAIDR
ncbi:hypothetical protein ACLSYN_01620 [Avibacterium avium]|uniref:hypothetical protein n=1 Tax=Avibacterium avium TaxID=751 RepID=UPI003BF84BD8